MNFEDASTMHLQRLLAEARAQQLGYSEVIARSSQRLISLTRMMLRNYSRLQRWEQTDDVFQSAVLRLYRSLTDVQPQSPREFLGLAAAQIRRTLIDLSRHHFGPEGAAAAHQTDDVSLQDGRPGIIATAADTRSPRPESLQEWTEFHEAIERLIPEQREVFELIWYGGLEQHQVARALDCSVPTVQRRWYASQIALCRILRECPSTTDSGSST